MEIRNLIGLLVITFSEWAGLAIWLVLILDGDTLLGNSLLQYSLATIILAVALIIEHFSAFAAFQPGKNLPVDKILLVALSETFLWAVWLFLSKDVLSDVLLGNLFGFVFLLITMFIQHNIETNLFQGRTLFDGFPFFFDMAKVKESYDFTLLEVIAGAYWLNLVLNDDQLIGLIILFVGLSIEHLISASTIGGGYRGNQVIRPEVTKAIDEIKTFLKENTKLDKNLPEFIRESAKMYIDKIKS